MTSLAATQPSAGKSENESGSGSESEKARLPKIQLLCRFETSSKAFNNAVKKHFPKLRDFTSVTIHNCSLVELPDDVQFDAIVSPANSYGFMDGAFDDAISIALSPNRREAYRWTTKKVHDGLYRKWRGYAPPGSCTIVDVRKDAAWHEMKRVELEQKPDAGAAATSGGDADRHVGGCKYVALCPTMRVPHSVKWDLEVVYECIWALLCAIDTHNREMHADPELHVNSILMTPLATGVGRVSEVKWATQCVLAIKYWVEAAVENTQKWSDLQWDDIDESDDALEATHDL